MGGAGPSAPTPTEAAVATNSTLTCEYGVEPDGDPFAQDVPYGSVIGLSKYGTRLSRRSGWWILYE